ncbi:MAG: YegS/Rv2252/BmrU family lipid kinase [Bacteroidota bacterium]
MSRKNILFIINPVSGLGRQKKVEKLVKEELDHRQFAHEFVMTKARKHATELARKAAEEGFDAVAAIGGDGTVNEVGTGLKGSKTALAILPCGSGNGAARHMKIPVDLEKAMQVINRFNVTAIDTFSLNQYTVVNTAGIGYAAHIAHVFSRLKKRGFSNYLKIAIRDSVGYRSQQCEVEYNGKKQSIHAFIIDIANGSQWGNNARIAPHAVNNDGLLDLCMVRDFPYRNFPIMATRLFLGSIDRSRYVEIAQVKEAFIRQEHTYAHIDGEPEEIGHELRIKIEPLSLRVIAP